MTPTEIQRGASFACYLTDSGKALALNIQRADTLFARMRGLLGAPKQANGQGLWIVPCKQVHTAFMPYDLDVVFLDREHIVVGFVSRLRPWRLSPFFLGAHSALELPGGSVERMNPGQRLTFARNKD
ncbi:MAG: DUF192 domain-containing protein [Deltaproteobacteria bacterium]|nr:DUF192 domain-containing protein [Deltaproteobacteria bacterium]